MNTQVLTNSDEVLITFSSMVRASHVCHLFTFLMPQVPKVHFPPDGTPIHSPQSLWAVFLCTHHSLIQNPNNSLAESQRWPSARDNSNVPFFLEWGTGLPDRHCHHWEQQKYNQKERAKEEQTLIGGSGGIRVKTLHRGMEGERACYRMWPERGTEQMSQWWHGFQTVPRRLSQGEDLGSPHCTKATFTSFVYRMFPSGFTPESIPVL